MNFQRSSLGNIGKYNGRNSGRPAYWGQVSRTGRKRHSMEILSYSGKEEILPDLLFLPWTHLVRTTEKSVSYLCLNENGCANLETLGPPVHPNTE